MEHMRKARAEAAARVGGRWDVRVLEPSPPAVDEPPFFADDPVAGGDVVPVERGDGSRSWAQVCQDEADPDLEAWCRDRWLVRGALAPLPAAFATTTAALHGVAEHVLAPARHAVNGKIGLRFTYHGFGTPFFGADRQVRVEDGELVVDDARHPLSTLGEAAKAAGVALGAPADVYTPVTECRADAALVVDPLAARALGDWYGYCASLLEQLRAESTHDDSPGRVQLWPEHFDLAVDLGPPDGRANFGGSPGDQDHAEPYLYVGPWEARQGAFWSEPFGASLPYSAILEGIDGLAFLREGRERLRLP
jgi:hypothetical protein